MKCIEIIDVPIGPNPLEERKAWVGLKLPLVSENVDEQVSAMGGYAVYTAYAVEILRLYNAEAAQCWDNKAKVRHLGDFLVFNTEACRLTDDLPSIIAEKGHNGVSMTVGEFMNALGKQSFEEELWPLGGKESMRSRFDISEEEWPRFEASAITRPIILFLSDAIAYECSFYIQGTVTEKRFNGAHKEGHGLLKAIHKLATDNGVSVTLEEIDVPLSFTDEGVRAGVIEEVGNRVRLTPKGEAIARGILGEDGDESNKKPF